MWFEINRRSVKLKAAEVEAGVYPDTTAGPYLPGELGQKVETMAYGNHPVMQKSYQEFPERR